ncbi:hypothetical protein [Cobetia sp. ICG0124]|uniref:hypothetical protein n=1 Tax=Cobetia sp. ICG0124 TaxID=2053669 RepID=UPI001F0BA097|nr:hypothetical protein [Cobetia sp. ICG0124]
MALAHAVGAGCGLAVGVLGARERSCSIRQVMINSMPTAPIMVNCSPTTTTARTPATSGSNMVSMVTRLMGTLASPRPKTRLASSMGISAM